MVALTKDRDTQTRDGKLKAIPVAAATKIFAGGIVCRNAAGTATPGATSVALKAEGRADEFVDNSSGAAGDRVVRVQKGVFKYANSAGADEIRIADVNSDCYIVDDQTVAKTNGTNTRSAAGKIFDVDENGVWVEFR